MLRTALCLALLAGPAFAQDDAPAAATPASPCAGEAHRQFDFWIGHWDVTQNGQPAGTNHIEAIDGGCALAENWTSANAGFTGHSLNSYDRVTGQWHQTWVDSGGTVLKLDGGLEDGAMVLSGPGLTQDGKPITNRITWTPAEDGSVRQHWEAFDGENWTTLFDGTYTRQAGAE